MTNSEALREELQRRCAGRLGQRSGRQGGKHALCNGMKARRAPIFPIDLSRSILLGCREQLRRDGVWSRASVGMQHHSFVNLCESLDDAQNDDLAREYICAMAGKDCIMT